jgi:hypothetical protein
MESNSLDETGEDFLGQWFLLRLHVDRCIIDFGARHANPMAYRSHQARSLRDSARRRPRQQRILSNIAEMRVRRRYSAFSRLHLKR